MLHLLFAWLLLKQEMLEEEELVVHLVLRTLVFRLGVFVRIWMRIKRISFAYLEMIDMSQWREKVKWSNVWSRLKISREQFVYKFDQRVFFWANQPISHWFSYVYYLLFCLIILIEWIDDDFDRIFSNLPNSLLFIKIQPFTLQRVVSHRNFDFECIMQEDRQTYYTVNR